MAGPIGGSGLVAAARGRGKPQAMSPAGPGPAESARLALKFAQPAPTSATASAAASAAKPAPQGASVTQRGSAASRPSKARTLATPTALSKTPNIGASFGESPAKTSRSEEHTSELQSLMRISYAVF